MFKEAFAGVCALFLFYLIFCLLWKKDRKTAKTILLSLLLFSCIANCIYNVLVMFPDFYMDVINGRFRYGTFSENLLAYSDEFMFRDEIIFPVLKNRRVSLDDTAGFYEKFVSLYADDYTTVGIGEAGREAVRSHHADFDFSHEFTCTGIMDYVTDDIPKVLLPSFEEERYPTLHINTASLKGQPRLVLVMEPDYSLYVMGEAYYEEIMDKGR